MNFHAGLWQQHLLTLALILQKESRTDSYTQALKPISHLRADGPACPENCSRKLQDSFHRVCKWMCVCGETFAKCPRMKRYSMSWESEWVYARMSACLWECLCVYVGEGGISRAGKGYTTVKDGERERGKKERKRERVGSMQRFWAWSANWSFPSDHSFPGPVYFSLMDRFTFGNAIMGTCVHKLKNKTKNY